MLASLNHLIIWTLTNGVAICSTVFPVIKLAWLANNPLGPTIPFSCSYFFTSSGPLRPFFLFMAMLLVQPKVQPDVLLCCHPHFVCSCGWLQLPLTWMNHPDTGTLPMPLFLYARTVPLRKAPAETSFARRLLFSITEKCFRIDDSRLYMYHIPVCPHHT